MDAVDAVLVDFTNNTPHLIATHKRSLPTILRAELLRLCAPGHDEINRMGQADQQVGLLFAETALELLAKANKIPQDICAIGSHGQTIRHQPQGSHPFTLQIGDPNVIAEKTGVTTIADFRRRDIAKGGQGAPLAPAFHNAIFRSAEQDRIILNLGGIANITWLPADLALPVIGFDTGPANTLIDAWASKHLAQLYDNKGQWAASGKINNALLEILLAEPYFKLSYPKSTGRELFNLAWLQKALDKQKNIAPADVQATLCELTALTVIQAINKLVLKKSTILICGGGIYNDYLIDRLRAQTDNYSIHSTEELGVSPDWVEAMTFAWLAQQTLAGKPGNLPSVTGAGDYAILGGIYPSHCYSRERKSR